ncbi:Aste57867_16088 [Aphanomyces stellatus]|uniref:Aste57867_16088 protein n=1 Tax=Aphanomyces stellatus TaxID=120398 RepID=A0A485L4T8_9STRA|nr:hypothetical protein As57867_016032 [Aphanomyces stellatus]VFT92871.1 Aste57867_16088 [Aphanomyces stellatus]
MAHLDNEFLNKKYQKWDNFKDDEDDIEAIPASAQQTQYDHAGEEDITVVDQMLLTPAQLEKFKRMDQKKSEIWQIVVRKLRVWSASSEGAAEGEEAIPCRPYAILVNNIYPLGQVVSKKICDPPQVFPSAQEILALSLDAMADPPNSIPQHRPDKIVFADKRLVGDLRVSYAALGIECTYLTESEGIDACISELSGHLIRKDMASIGSVSEKPGLLSLGISPDQVKEFYATCAKFAELQPWRRMVERQAIQIDASSSLSLNSKPNSSVQGGSVYVSVLGHVDDPTKEDSLKGMALFFTRTDLQRRVLPPGQTLALMENPALRRCAACDKKAPADKELKRCTRCQCVFYCDANCQRSHWKDHKINCVDPSKQQDQKQQWGARELSVFFGGITSMTFDDLDAIDKYDCRVAEGSAAYPTPLLFRNGEASLPTSADLLWLVRGMQSIIQMQTTSPGFMNASMPELLGLKEDETKLTLTISTMTQENEPVVIRNSSVLSMHDVQALRELVQKRQEEKNSATPPPAPTDGDAPATSDESSCSIM